MRTLMRRRYGQHIHVFPQLAYVYAPEWLDHMLRVCGRALCGVCGKTYDEHPQHPDYPQIPTLVVTCRGRPVKT